MNTLKYVTLSQFLLFSLICIFLILFADHSNDYLKVGPHDNLIVLTIKIDSIKKYIGIFILILIINVIQTMNYEIAMPILRFNIYNPDKKYITEYTQKELYIYGNTIFMINAFIKKVLLILLSISQIDIAIWSVTTSELTSIVITKKLLDNKIFTTEDNNIV